MKVRRSIIGPFSCSEQSATASPNGGLTLDTEPSFEIRRTELRVSSDGTGTIRRTEAGQASSRSRKPNIMLLPLEKHRKPFSRFRKQIKIWLQLEKMNVANLAPVRETVTTALPPQKPNENFDASRKFDVEKLVPV